MRKALALGWGRKRIDSKGDGSIYAFWSGIYEGDDSLVIHRMNDLMRESLRMGVMAWLLPTYLGGRRHPQIPI